MLLLINPTQLSVTQLLPFYSLQKLVSLSVCLWQKDHLKVDFEYYAPQTE